MLKLFRTAPRRATLLAVLGAALALPLIVSTPAEAWWRGGGGWGWHGGGGWGWHPGVSIGIGVPVGPPVYYAPPPVYYGPPPVVYAAPPPGYYAPPPRVVYAAPPARAWVPGYWSRGVWIEGHWR